MKRITITGLAVLSGLLFGCGPSGGGPGGGPAAKDPTGKTITTGNGQAVSEVAANKFKAGLDQLAQHDKAKDWAEASCTSTAQLFLDAASEQGKPFAEAQYNAGLAHLRCKKNAEAKAQFQKALEADSKFHPAKTQLVLMSYYDSGEKNIDQAITDMRQTAVVDAQYKNVEALVALAMLYMKRSNSVADSDGANDYQRAKRYLQSALAVDDGYMPAFNQLALFYLETAKQAAGMEKSSKSATNISKKKKTASQAMELADLVCSQAVRKNPNDPVIFNTLGMIQVELGNLNKAVEAFDKARQKDPNFYEAQMNFAAVNLQFRGFPKAEEAYRAVLKNRPERLRRSPRPRARAPRADQRFELRRLRQGVGRAPRQGEGDRARAAGDLLQRSDPHAGVQDEGGHGPEQGRAHLPPGEGSLRSVRHEGRRRGGVLRRRQAREGAHHRDRSDHRLQQADGEGAQGGRSRRQAEGRRGGGRRRERRDRRHRAPRLAPIRTRSRPPEQCVGRIHRSAEIASHS
jgi:tetratricopeptide (TPR) repeat protein